MESNRKSKFRKSVFGPYESRPYNREVVEDAVRRVGNKGLAERIRATLALQNSVVHPDHEWGPARRRPGADQAHQIDDVARISVDYGESGNAD